MRFTPGPALALIPSVWGDDTATQLKDNLLSVYAENGTSHIDYNFKLTYNQANTEAELESFSIGTSTGRISGNDVYITVPYGSDLMGLIPTFTVSDYASVKLDFRTGEDVISGKTSVNFNQTVRLMVISEDGQKTNPYNVHVTVSEDSPMWSPAPGTMTTSCRLLLPALSAVIPMAPSSLATA